MSSVSLIMILWLTVGAEPTKVKIEAENLHQCMEYAQQFLESETAKQAAAASAGCVVIYPPKKGA
jgi:hypothetical protein